MKSTYLKKYLEAYAGACIMNCFPDLNWKLELNSVDPPDLIDIKKNIGVEVTKSILEKDAELDSLLEKFKEMEEKDIPTGVLKTVNYGRDRFVYIEKDGKNVLFGCSHDARTIDHEQIKNRIMDKIGDLNSGRYEDYNIDALYIDNEHSFIFDSDLSDLIKFMNYLSKKNQRYYSYLFIYTNADLYMCDLEKGTAKKKCITESMRENIREEALLVLDRMITR